MDLSLFSAIPEESLSPHQRIPYFTLVFNGEHRFKYETLIFKENSDNRAPNMVALYACRALTQVVCLKTTSWEEHGESEVVDFYNSHMKGSSAMVPARVLHRARKLPRDAPHPTPVNFNAIVMTFLGPTMHKVGLGLRQTVEVVIQVAHHCEELLKAGLCYTDLKPCNVCIDNELKPTLIDYRIGYPSCTATYPPPEYPHGYGIKGDERVVVHGIGVLLALSLGCSSANDCLGYELSSEVGHAQASKRIRANISKLVAGCANMALRAVYISLTLAAYNVQDHQRHARRLPAALESRSKGWRRGG